MSAFDPKRTLPSANLNGERDRCRVRHNARTARGALLIGADPFLSSRSQQIVALAARDAIPTLYYNRADVEEGGLMRYGNDTADGYRRAGVYVRRILNGASPADLPVDQATKFEFVINLKTAKKLGVNVPPGLSARADDVIE